MTQYAVVAFPRSDANDMIEALRRRFDPQASLIAAHVTVVFPFAAATSVEQLRPHIEAAVHGVAPFEILLDYPAAAEGEYVLLNVLRGAASAQTLYERLYTGPLAVHRSSAKGYEPHITLGRLSDPGRLAAAVAEAKTALPNRVEAEIASLAVFQLDGTTSGRVALTIPLATRREPAARSAMVPTTPDVGCS